LVDRYRIATEVKLTHATAGPEYRSFKFLKHHTAWQTLEVTDRRCVPK